jgi:hypothetical protein
MATKKLSVPAPPSSKPSKLRSKSKGSTDPGGRTTSGKAPVKKVNPWDLPAIAAQAPGKQKKTSAAQMKKDISGWSPHHR